MIAANRRFHFNDLRPVRQRLAEATRRPAVGHAHRSVTASSPTDGCGSMIPSDTCQPRSSRNTSGSSPHYGDESPAARCNSWSDTARSETFLRVLIDPNPSDPLSHRQR